MAFNMANFTNQGPQNFFSNGQPAGNQLAYTTADTIATIDGDITYFDSLSNEVRKYDYILVIANGVKGFYIITNTAIGSSVSFTRLW